MAMKCDVGDLCMIVNDLEYPLNYGKCVRILRAAEDDEFEGDEVDWFCVAVSPGIKLPNPDGSMHVFEVGDGGLGYRDREICPCRDI